MIATELRGPAGVRHDVAEFLRAILPSHLEACRAAWGLRTSELVAPKSSPGDPRHDAYLPREPRAIDRWPLIAVTSGRVVTRQVDFSLEGDPIYRSDYPIRVYSWVKAAGFDACQDLRDNMGTAIRIAFLAHTNLAQRGPYTVQPATVVVDFSDVTAVNGDRFVAGSYIGFTLEVVETLTDRLALPGGQPRDTVSGVTATGAPLPHPALD